MSREAKVQKLTASGLYLVTDDRLPLAALLERTRQAIAAGVQAVQYRDKGASKREVLGRAERVRELCAANHVLFLVNDHLDVCLALKADGLHLGQEDFPADRARELLGPEPLLGLSVSSLDEALAAERVPVDYLGVGAMFPTETKPEAEYGGLELLGSVRRAVALPLVGIGGITVERAPEVIAAGADAVAVVNAVYGAADSGLAARRLLQAIANARGASATL